MNPELPNGIKYSLTLHDPQGERIFGIDNAHRPKKQRGPAAKSKRAKAADHLHRGGRVYAYEFKDAETLLADFDKGVNAALKGKGVKSMKQIKVGIMPLKDFQAYTKAIVTGKHKRKRGEPEIWFSSMASLAQVLSDQNRELLSLIAEQKPESISELAELSQRSQSNLTRTLRTMENYGLVKMKTGTRGKKQPLVPYSDIVVDMSICDHVQAV